MDPRRELKSQMPMDDEKPSPKGLQPTGVPRNRRELRAAIALTRSKTKLAKAKNGLRSNKRR